MAMSIYKCIKEIAIMKAFSIIKLSVIFWWLALFVILFFILVGLLAGIYPVNRAVKLSSIEAMRNN